MYLRSSIVSSDVRPSSFPSYRFTPDSSSSGKRKRNDVGFQDLRTRPRLEDHRQNTATGLSPPIMHNAYGPSSSSAYDAPLQDPRSHQRVSNLRTSVEMAEQQQQHYGSSPDNNMSHQSSVDSGFNPHPHSHGQRMLTAELMRPLPGDMPPPDTPGPYAGSIPSNMTPDPVSGIGGSSSNGKAPWETSRLPFSGYDFLGDDLYALLGNGGRTNAEMNSQMFEENAQLLWQAYGQQDPMGFGGSEQR